MSILALLSYCLVALIITLPILIAIILIFHFFYEELSNNDHDH